MKGRIARLEGSTRKFDASNSSLKKYVSMLERSIKEREAKYKALVKSGGKEGAQAEETKGKEDLAVKDSARRKLNLGEGWR